MSEIHPIDRGELELVLRGEHGHPHAVLGPHPHDGGVTVRVFKPLAASVVVRWTVDGETSETPLTHEHDGIWVGVLPVAEVPDYRLAVAYDVPSRRSSTTPTASCRRSGEIDLHLINEGRHEQLWEVLGAHVQHYDVPDRRRHRHLLRGLGARAPGACGCKADFNSWDGREHPMRQLGTSGRLGAVRARRRAPGAATSS